MRVQNHVCVILNRDNFYAPELTGKSSLLKKTIDFLVWNKKIFVACSTRLVLFVKLAREIIHTFYLKHQTCAAIYQRARQAHKLSECQYQLCAGAVFQNEATMSITNERDTADRTTR